MKPFQETNYIAKDKENEQWKSSLPPEEVKEKMLAQRGFTQENGSKIQFDHTVFIQYAMTRVHALYCNGKLYFYNFKSKCYEYLEDHAYKKIFFAIIEEASCNIWKRKQENEYIPYFKRKVPYAEDNGMRPGLLQFQNCIFNLQEETIEKPTPDIFCLVQIPYDYDSKAKAPQFSAFCRNSLTMTRHGLIWFRRSWEPAYTMKTLCRSLLSFWVPVPTESLCYPT